MITAVSAWFRTYGFGEIIERLLIGAYPSDADDVEMLRMQGVGRILNLIQDEEYRPGERAGLLAALEAAGIEEHRIRLTDFGGLHPALIEWAVEIVGDWLQAGETVYLHCRAGWQRSAAIAAGVVAIERDLDIEQALDWVRQAKPSANPLEHQRADLLEWWQDRASRGGVPRRPDAQAGRPDDAQAG
jgi:protein-tyrosine phosphatase